jgi:hypothetical protein
MVLLLGLRFINQEYYVEIVLAVSYVFDTTTEVVTRVTVRDIVIKAELQFLFELISRMVNMLFCVNYKNALLTRED